MLDELPRIKMPVKNNRMSVLSCLSSRHGKNGVIVSAFKWLSVKLASGSRSSEGSYTSRKASQS